MFNSTYSILTVKMRQAIDNGRFERFVKEMENKPYLENMVDHLGRPLLHVAVEKTDINFVSCLV